MLLISGVAFGAWLWVPMAAVRRQFGYELDRFTTRIQGMATEGELAELARAELKVKDEASLRAFLSIAADIAGRYDASGLVSRFDPWAQAANSAVDD